ncbi:nucleoside recognition domain-containing protein [Staphylococcus pseudintermedius]
MDKLGIYPALQDLVTDGIIAGVGGVLVFIPQILVLFFFISLLEDSGYMARIAVIMDRLMEKFGLNGKSFIPMIIGFGCNVPGIMAAAQYRRRKRTADDHFNCTVHVMFCATSCIWVVRSDFLRTTSSTCRVKSIRVRYCRRVTRKLVTI